MNDEPIFDSPQHRILSRAWPMTTGALQKYFYPERGWACTTMRKYNLAGYASWALARAEQRAISLHGEPNAGRRALDYMFAQETAYHGRARRLWKSPIHVLAVCWYNMVGERPEKLIRARRLTCIDGGSAPPPGHADASRCPTETQSWLTGKTRFPKCPVPIGYVLPELMQPNLPAHRPTNFLLPATPYDSSFSDNAL